MARPTNASGKKKSNVRPASTRPTGFYYVLGAVALIGASILGYSMMRKPASAAATDAVTPVTPIGTAEGYLIGKPDAPVKILEGILGGLWSLTRKGIFFITRNSGEDAISLYRLEDGSATTLANLPFRISSFGGGMAVSEDGRWLLTNQLNRRDTDLMLIDNFR